MHKQLGDGELISYRGYIKNTVPGFLKFSNGKYDEDEGVYAYDLLKDYAEGSFEIVGRTVLVTHAGTIKSTH